jgi:hypothetical protein
MILTKFDARRLKTREIDPCAHPRRASINHNTDNSREKSRFALPHLCRTPERSSQAIHVTVYVLSLFGIASCGADLVSRLEEPSHSHDRHANKDNRSRSLVEHVGMPQRPIAPQ